MATLFHKSAWKGNTLRISPMDTTSTWCDVPWNQTSIHPQVETTGQDQTVHLPSFTKKQVFQSTPGTLKKVKLLVDWRLLSHSSTSTTTSLGTICVRFFVVFVFSGGIQIWMNHSCCVNFLHQLLHYPTLRIKSKGPFQDKHLGNVVHQAPNLKIGENSVKPSFFWIR